MNIAVSRDPVINAVYLRTLPSIRERCSRVHELAQRGGLEYFEYNADNEKDVTEYCLKIIQVSSF